MQDILKNRVKKSPLSSGVYRWLGNKGEILYIGRATSLRKRLLQYFRPDLDPRIAEMVALAKQIRFEKTDTLLDAIILEANLIKKYWPKYNVKDKDDRSFSYVIIPKGDYSYPIIARQSELKKFPIKENQIFGPYQNQYLLRQALKIIRRIFPYGTCRANSGKPCFDYQIGLCPGKCIGAISREAYNQNIKNILLLFQGKKQRLFAKLKKENPEKILALKHLQEAQLITRDELGEQLLVNRIEAYDISHLSGKETYGSMAVFTGGRPDKDQYRLFKIKTAAAADDLAALAEVVSRRFNHPEWQRPDIILIDGGRPQIFRITKELKSLNIALPLVGLSKLAGDELVYPAGVKKVIKDLIDNIKPTLQRARDEAHRFANRGRKMGTKLR
jgi:excinuclease ABC subunit C